MLQRVTPRTRRILMTVDAVGGVWQYATELSRQLVAQGDMVVLAGLGPRPSALQCAQAEAIGTLVWLDTPPDWLADGPSSLAAFGDEIAPLVKTHGIDVLHVNAPALAGVANVTCPIVSVSHSCVVSWFRIVEGRSPPAEWAWHEDANRAGFERADLTVAPSESHAGALMACYGPIERLRIVHNAVGQADAVAERGRSILAAGRWWDAGKNGAVLDEAAALTSVPIECAGPTTGPNGQAANFSKATMLGPLSHEETRRRMAGALAFVSPSVYEPFGLAALEAASARTPLILSDIPTYRELWDGAALFFPPNDATALAGVMDLLAQQPALQDELGLAALRRSRDFTPERQAAAMSEIYEQVVAQHQRSL